MSDRVWIVSLDDDSFNYFPKQVRVEDAIKEGLPYYSTEKECNAACDQVNSL